jgi:hypothetical protein
MTPQPQARAPKSKRRQNAQDQPETAIEKVEPKLPSETQEDIQSKIIHSETIDPQSSVVVSPTIVQNIFNVFLQKEKGGAEDALNIIAKLSELDISYNSKRLSVLREHAATDPDAIEERKTSAFRRHQYIALICFLPVLLACMVFMPVASGFICGVTLIVVICGLILNGRERSEDGKQMAELIRYIVDRFGKGGGK